MKRTLRRYAVALLASCLVPLVACGGSETTTPGSGNVDPTNPSGTNDAGVSAPPAPDAADSEATPGAVACAPMNLEAYRGSSCFCGDACDCFVDVPFGDAATWTENNQTFKESIDIYLPKGSTTAKPLVLWAHPNGSTKAVGAGGPVAKNFGTPLLAEGFGFASVEFRHPAANADIQAPQTDIADAIQFLRCHANEIHLDAPRIAAVGRSRGTLTLLTTLKNDGANPTSPKPEARHSTRLRGVFAINAQTSYWGKWIGETFYDDASRPLFYAYYGEANYGHAVGEVSPDDPPVRLVYDSQRQTLPFAASECIPLGGDVDCVHLANFGDELCKAYTAAGIPDKCTVTYGVPANDLYAGIEFLKGVLQ